MSKSNIRKIPVDPTKCNIDSRRPSVFERLGTKPALTAAAQNASDYCRNWALNGNCSYGKSCKYANTHTLISPSKRVKKDNASTNPSLLIEDPFKRLTSKIVKTSSHSPDLNIDEWNQTDLEYEDEKVLERRRQLLQRELELQMKKDKEVHGKEKIKYKKKAMSSSSSSHSSSSSSSSSTSSSDDSSSSSTSDSRKKIKKFKKKHSASPDFDEDKERRRKVKSPLAPTSHAVPVKPKDRTRSESPRLKLPSRADLEKDRHHKKLREHEELSLKEMAQKKSSDRLERGDRLERQERLDRLDRSDRLERKEPEKPRARPPEPDKPSGRSARSSERPKARSRDRERRSRSPERSKHPHPKELSRSRRSRSADKPRIRHEPLPPPPGGSRHADKGPGGSGGSSRSREHGRRERERSKDREPSKLKHHHPSSSSTGGSSGQLFGASGPEESRRQPDYGRQRSKERGHRDEPRARNSEREREERREREPAKRPGRERDRERERLAEKPAARSGYKDRLSERSKERGAERSKERPKEREREHLQLERERHRRYKPAPPPAAPPAGLEARRDSPNRREYERAYARLTGSGAAAHAESHSRHWDETEEPQPPSAAEQYREPADERRKPLEPRRYDSPFSERRPPGSASGAPDERGQPRYADRGAPPPGPGPFEPEPLLHHPIRPPPIREEAGADGWDVHHDLERPYGAGSEWDEREWRPGARGGGWADREGLPPRPEAPHEDEPWPATRYDGAMPEWKVGETGRKWDNQHTRSGYRNDRIKEIELTDPTLCNKRRPFNTPERREELPSHAAKQALHNSMKDEPINKKLMELAEGRPRKSREKSADSFHKKLLVKEKPPPEVKEPPATPIEAKRPCLDEALPPIQHTESDLSDISDDPDDILNMEEEVTENKYPPKSNDADRDSASVKSQDVTHPSPKAPIDDTLFTKDKDTTEAYSNKNTMEDESMENMDFEEISDGELEEDIKTSCKGLGDALGVDWESLVKESQPRRPTGTSHDNAQDRWQCKAVFQRIGISVKAAGHEFVEKLLNKYVDDESNKLLLNNVAFVHTALARKQLMPNSTYKTVNNDEFLYRAKSDVDLDDIENLKPCTSLYEEAKMLVHQA